MRTEPSLRGNGSPMTSFPIVYVVDSDEAIRQSVGNLAGIMNLRCKPFATGDEFLEGLDLACPGCLVTEIRVPGISGLQIQQALIQRGATLPVIFLSNHASVAIAVHAMRAGAVQFFEKPCREDDLWRAIDEAIEFDQQQRQRRVHQEEVERYLATLSEKEQFVLA